MSRDVAVTLGVITIGAVIWLAFVNWHAAVIVLLLIIAGKDT